MAFENNSLNNNVYKKEKKIVAITNKIKELPYEVFKEKVWRGGDFDGVVGRRYSEERLYDYMKGRNFHVVFYEKNRKELRQIIRDEILYRKRRKKIILLNYSLLKPHTRA